MNILDLTAGRRAMWFDKGNPRVTFVDKRAETNPTVCADITKLNGTNIGRDYDLVVFDPPHENCGATGNMTKFYGHSTRDEILEFIKCAAIESHRVTKPNALMALKWNDRAFTLDQVLDLMKDQWEPLFGSHLRNQGGPSAKTQTFWVMLLRKGQQCSHR